MTVLSLRLLCSGAMAAATVAACRTEPDSQGITPSTFGSIEEWVDASDVIVVGRVEAVESSALRPTITPEPRDPEGSPEDFPWADTVYRYAVEDIIKNDGAIGATVRVEVLGLYPQPGDGPWHPMPEPGDQRMLFLQRGTYDFGTPVPPIPGAPLHLVPAGLGSLLVDSGSVKWPDFDHHSVGLAVGMTSEDFIETVRQAAAP